MTLTYFKKKEMNISNIFLSLDKNFKRYTETIEKNQR